MAAKPSALDYTRIVAKHNVNVPDDFWRFWATYYRLPSDQQEETRRLPHWKHYNDLIWHIHSLAEQEANKKAN